MKTAVDPTFQTLAARYLRKQIKQLAGQLDGIRKAEDIEFIHRARVATRRLRAGLKFFAECFPADRVKTWRKELRRLARSFGDARDQDVQIAFLCDVLSRLQELPYVAGVARVLVRWERRREKLQPEVLRAVRRLLSSRVLREMLVATKKWRPGDAEVEPWKPSEALLTQAEGHILSRLEELRAFEPCLADPQDKRQHHAMRIAAKRLRYTVEICRPMYAGRVDGVLESIKQVQSLLGDIHDCDVWMDQLDAFSVKQAKRLQILYGHPGPLARVKAGIEYLRQDRAKRRDGLFSTLTQYWRDLVREGLWEGLAAVMKDAGRAAGDEWRTAGDAARAAGDDRLRGCGGDGVNDGNVATVELSPIGRVAAPGAFPLPRLHPVAPSPSHPIISSSATRHPPCNPARN
jgi:CHAD domain-containing protein